MRLLLIYYRLVTVKSPFNHSLKWVKWLEDNRKWLKESAKVVRNASGIVALLEIISPPPHHPLPPPPHQNSVPFTADWKAWSVEGTIKRACRLKAMSPGSSALLLEQWAIVYSLPHWHSKCILTVLSHNQQVAIFMHVKVEGKLFMGDWTWGKRTASSKMVYVESNPFL